LEPHVAWIKEDKRLQKQGVKKKDRPPVPPNDPEYPSKSQLVLRLMEQFRQSQPQVSVKAIAADALYGQVLCMVKCSVWSSGFDGCSISLA